MSYHVLQILAHVLDCIESASEHLLEPSTDFIAILEQAQRLKQNE